MFFVFAVEIGRVIVSHSHAGAGSVKVLTEHQSTGLLQTQLFLELDRTHRGNALELMMKTGNAHAQATGDVFYVQRLTDIFSNFFDCP